ncbi:MarR family transcriptional regulator [Xylanimonas allomyrinae]|uniref:MarR family transcriptional regulator n=1 Tax=Xylanimonas allomyrinae TaxID=2509459 RepID=A0A4P6EK88_9MICO|nr:MarR family transcriptional regulator [Xylanimonas allomyrinae]QAY62516.1 MarR family transcriptional regulator [Xylanimonas allomyrinae]
MEHQHDDVAWAFVDALHAASRSLRRDTLAAGTTGVSPGQLRLLRTLAHAPGPLRAVDLADALGVAPRSVTTKVDQAEEDGFVRRLADPSDRRARLVALTDAGREALDRVSLERRRGAAQRLRRLSPTEREELVRLLRVVAADD